MEKKGEEQLLLSGEGDDDHFLWHLDIIGSNHISGNNDLFINHDESYNGQIVFEDNTKVEIEDEGGVLILTKGKESVKHDI